MLTGVQIADMMEVWQHIRTSHPEFTELCDISGNYHSVREIVLGGSTGWAGVHQRWEPKPGMRVMDIGANAGIFSAYCAVNGAVVVAYEPFIAAYLQLTKMIEQADLGMKILAVNKAVWHFTGFVRYIGNITSLDGACTVFNGGLETAGVPWTRNDIETAPFISCVTLDDAISDLEWDCVKVDIEGAEAEMILSARPDKLAQIKFMYVEFHPWIPKELYERMITKLQSIYRFEGLHINNIGRWEAAYLTRG